MDLEIIKDTVFNYEKRLIFFIDGLKMIFLCMVSKDINMKYANI